MQQFIQLIMNTFSQWGVIGSWLLWLISNPWWILVAIIGWLAWNHVWEGAKSWVVIGPTWWKVLFWAVVLAGIGLFAFGMLFRYVPVYGNWLVTQLKDGALSVSPIVPPQPGEALPADSPLSLLSTPIASTTPISSPLGTPIAAASNNLQPTSTSAVTGLSCYRITDLTGATARTGPTSSAAPVGSIAYGTVVKVDETVQSNTVSGISLRARLAEAAAGVPAGAWFHLSAAVSATCP